MDKFTTRFEELRKLLHSSNQKQPNIDIQKATLIDKIENEAGSNAAIYAKNILFPQVSEAALNTPPIDAEKYGEAFSLERYNKILNFTKLAYCYENNGIAEEHALKLSVIFNDVNAALDYLTECGKNMGLESKLVHDACLFQLPDPKDCRFDIWKELANKNKNMNDPDFRKLLPSAGDIQQLIVNDGKKNKDKKVDKEKIKEVEKKLAANNKARKELARHHGQLTAEQKNAYQKIIHEISDLNVELSHLYAGTRLSQASCSMLKAYYERYKKETEAGYSYFIEHGLTRQDYEKFKTLKRVNDDTQIPNITLDGATIGYPGFYMMKVDVLDEAQAVRAACLGKLTGCCQSLSGEAGEPCVIHGLTSDKGGFYVLCKGNVNNPRIEDEVYAQSWVWRSQKAALVFDSIEVKQGKDQMVRNFYRFLGHQLVTTEQYHIPKVACGATSGISKHVGAKAVGVPERPIDYSKYRDSHKQLLIASNDMPYLILSKDTSNELKDMIEEQTKALLMRQFEGQSPLKHNAVIEKLIIFAQTNEAEELLQFARNCAGPRLDELNEIIELNKLNDKGNTNLRKAIIEGSLDEVKQWIERGVYVNLPYKDGDTPLILAVKFGRKDVISLLLEKGADVDLVEKRDRTALHYAALEESKDFAFLLLEKGADIDPEDKSRNTPLIEAAARNKDIVSLLLEKGANIEHKGNNNSTALIVAANSGKADIVSLLLEKGAAFDIKNSGTTLLLNAENGHKDMVALLLEKGVAIDAENEFGTPLMLAAKKGHIDVISLLLDKGANFDYQNKFGNTALMLAVRDSRKKDGVLKLLEKGADINIENQNGETALMLAVSNRDKDMVVLLLEKGAAIDTQDEHFAKALDAAKKNRFTEIVTLLEDAQAAVNKPKLKP